MKKILETKQPIIIIIILVVLLPLMAFVGLYTFTQYQAANQRSRIQKQLEIFNTLPEVADQELSAKIIFSTDQLTTQEQDQIINYLLENNRRVIINSAKIEFVSPEINREGFSNICRDWGEPLTILLIGRVNGANNDINKSGAIYLTKKPDQSNWQECISHIGPL
jgi:hypothetical protein